MFPPADVFLYPSRSFLVSRALMSLRASLGRQKPLNSSSRRPRAPLSTRAKLSRSKKGSKGPRTSRAVPSISPSACEEPCGAPRTVSGPGLLLWRWGRVCSEFLSPSVPLFVCLLHKPEATNVVCSFCPINTNQIHDSHHHWRKPWFNLTRNSISEFQFTLNAQGANLSF